MKNGRFISVLILIYHLIFSYFSWRVSSIKKGDAFRYWFVGEDLSNSKWEDYFSLGTNVVKIITFPLVKYLHLPFWSGFLIFSGISAIGVWMLFNMLWDIAGKNQKLQLVTVLLMLLPSLHFWTSMPAKESVIFTLFIVFLKYNTGRKPFHIFGLISVVLISFIRPHFAIMVCAPWFISVLWKHRMKKKHLWFFAGTSLLGTAAIFFLLRRILFRFEGFATTIVRYYDSHIRVFQTTNSYVPLDQYSLPFKIFTFWFRPFPFEKTGFLYMVISLENTVLLLLSIVLLCIGVRNLKKREWSLFSVFGWIYITVFTIIYCFGYANYGIISRTKIMLLPVFYMLLLQSLHFNTKVSHVFRTPFSKP